MNKELSIDVPKSTDIEKAVLYFMIFQENMDLFHLLKSDDFYDPRNKKIFGGIKILVAKRIPVDFRTITNYFSSEEIDKKNKETIPYLLTQIGSEDCRGKTNYDIHDIEQYINILQELRIKRNYHSRALMILEGLKNNYDLPSLRKISDSFSNDKINLGKLTTMSSIHIDDISWFWQDWLACGYVTMIGGRSGIGKSYITLSIVQRFLQKKNWGDGSENKTIPRKVLWIEGEAGQRVNALRMKKLGIDSDKVVFPTDDPYEMINLHDDSIRQKIENIAKSNDIGLLVFDSLRGLTRGDENDSSNAEVVQWIANLATKCELPVILVHHVGKQKKMYEEEPSIIRSFDDMRGTSAYIQYCRIVVGLDDPCPDSNVKRLRILKSNIGNYPDPIGIVLTDEGVYWTKDNLPFSKVNKHSVCVTFLRDILSSGLPVDTKIIYERADALGIKRATLYRSADSLGVDKRGSSWILRERRYVNEG